MPSRNTCLLMLIATILSPWRMVLGGEISVEGAPAESAFNVGSVATIHVTVRGMTGNASRYAVFAEIQYAGTTSTTDVQMDRVAEPRPGVAEYEIGWPIPVEAPTGLYTVAVQVEDRSDHSTVTTKTLGGFGAYRKLIHISHLATDKTSYNPGEPIRCEVTLENLSDSQFKDLRIEFSNANYPWDFPYSGNPSENPEFALKVLSDHLVLPALGTTVIPMTTAGTASLFQGKQREALGVGGAAPQGNTPETKVDTYAVAVWNAERTVLYDLQFTQTAIAKPHTMHREPRTPGMVSDIIFVDHSRTLYRPGDQVRVTGRVRNQGNGSWSDAELRATVMDAAGKTVQQETLPFLANLGPGQTQAIASDVWAIPAGQAPGNYRLRLELLATGGKHLAETEIEIAVNILPASVLVFCPHAEDVSSYAGLIRAAIEARVPVRVVILADSDAGACGRYDNKLCGPNEARKSGMDHMEESRNALEHLGLSRDKVVFVGLPDGGSGAIWSQHIKSSSPYLSVYLACDHAPFEQIFKPNLPYARDSVIGAIERIISDFHPALIALPHPDERRMDHHVTNWFVIKACQESLREKRMDPDTLIWSHQAYDAGDSKSAPYAYEKVIVFLSGEGAALGQEMKGTFSEMPHREEYLRILDWQEHKGWNE